MADLQLENVTKIYSGGFIAVNNLSLEVRDSEFVVLVGPSGCGKTTTLRLVAGLEKITAGRVLIAGKVVNDTWPESRDVAMVFQSYALYPHMTVYNNMAFGLKLRRVPRREIKRRVFSAAGILGIEGLLDRKPNTLSGGQRQRVALGRAMVRNPNAFLFDEPLSNLDAGLRVQMRTELKKLQRSLGTTTVYVTHDHEEALTLGDRVAVMNGGVVHQCGTPLEVYDKPVNRFVAGFIGTPPMNFIQGRLFAQNGCLCFGQGSDKIRIPDRLEKFLAGRVNNPVVLGIRPEFVSVATKNELAGLQDVLHVTIDAVEPKGGKFDLHARTAAGDKLVFRIRSDRPPRNGAKLALHLNMNQVHFFEPGDEGVNIILQKAGGRDSAD